MKKSRTFSTVTPLSKTLALIAFLVLPVIGFYAGTEYKKAIDPLQGDDPRTAIFSTQQECETSTNRTCLPTLCEQNAHHESCQSNNQKGWFATRQEIEPDSADDTTDTTRAQCSNAGGTWVEKFNECENIDQLECQEAGGTFNACASPCRHDPDAEACAMVCVGVCTL